MPLACVAGGIFSRRIISTLASTIVALLVLAATGMGTSSVEIPPATILGILNSPSTSEREIRIGQEEIACQSNIFDMSQGTKARVVSEEMSAAINEIIEKALNLLNVGRETRKIILKKLKSKRE